MRLKPIKPGMVIHFETDEEKKMLLEALEEQGYVWTGGAKPTTDSAFLYSTLHVYSSNKTIPYKHITLSNDNGNTKFSDLIIPELSAEEVLEICHQICKGKSCNECLMRKNCFAGDEPDFKKVVEICEKWKAENSQKEPEVEWADICRIIQIEESGVKKCVHEQTMKNCENAEDEAANILKWYVAENVGNYIAVVEHVCRIKK